MWHPGPTRPVMERTDIPCTCRQRPLIRFQTSAFLVPRCPPPLGEREPPQEEPSLQHLVVHCHRHLPRAEMGNGHFFNLPSPSSTPVKGLYFQIYSQIYYYYKSSILGKPLVGEGLCLKKEWDKKIRAKGSIMMSKLHTSTWKNIKELISSSGQEATRQRMLVADRARSWLSDLGKRKTCVTFFRRELVPCRC